MIIGLQVPHNRIDFLAVKAWSPDNLDAYYWVKIMVAWKCINEADFNADEASSLVFRLQQVTTSEELNIIFEILKQLGPETYMQFMNDSEAREWALDKVVKVALVTDDNNRPTLNEREAIRIIKG